MPIINFENIKSLLRKLLKIVQNERHVDSEFFLESVDSNFLNKAGKILHGGGSSVEVSPGAGEVALDIPHPRQLVLGRGV